MNIEEAAEILNGSQYGEEGYDSPNLWKEMKEAGLVAVFGASDDLVEFRGAIYDEAGAYNGGFILISENGIVEEPDCDCRYASEWHQAQKESATVSVVATWCPVNAEGASWEMMPSVPYASFKVFEDDDLYCIGAVFELP